MPQPDPVISGGAWHAPPTLHASFLSARNVLRRWPWLPTALVLTCLGLGLLGRLEIFRRMWGVIADAPSMVCLVTTGLLSVIMIRGRRRLQSRRHRDWLGALPRQSSLATQAILAPGPGAMLAVVIVTLQAASSGLPTGAVISLVAAIGAGYLGAVILLLVTRLFAAATYRDDVRGRVDNEGSPQSRYAIVRRARPEWASRPRLLPLGFWPVAQTKFWDRPKLRARRLVFLLLAVPLDMPGAVVLLLASVWLLALHLINLQIAVIRVAFHAAYWLAPTPMGGLRFWAALSHRALLGQIVTCALLVGVATAVRGRPDIHVALRLAATWLGLACVLCAGACALALVTGSVARSTLHRWLR